MIVNKKTEHQEIYETEEEVRNPHFYNPMLNPFVMSNNFQNNAIQEIKSDISQIKSNISSLPVTIKLEVSELKYQNTM